MHTLTKVPDFDQLRALVAVAQAGSMSGAASRLGISQQAVSARIRKAEQLIGLAVFQRFSHGVMPTDAGRCIVTWAGDVLDAAKHLHDGVLGLIGDGASATIAASNTISECLLPGWAATLRARHPGARLHMLPGNSETVLQAVLSGSADLGFVECPLVPRTVRWRRVGTDHLVVVAAPDHPWARRARPITRAELAGVPLVVRESGSGTRSTLEQALPEAMPPLAELGSTAAVRDAVLVTGAPAVLSELAVTADVAAGRLTKVPLADLGLPRVLRAVWNPGQRPKTVAADLLQIAIAATRLGAG